MTKEQILEGNRLIAEYLGWYKSKTDLWSRPEHYVEENGEQYSELWERVLKFHSSWDWLMPVVEKISQYRYDDYADPRDVAYPVTFGMPDEFGRPMVRFCRQPLFFGSTLIEAAWLAVVDFIQFNSEQSAQASDASKADSSTTD